MNRPRGKLREVEQSSMESGFARTYSAELLFENTPHIDKRNLLANLRKRCGRVDPLDGSDQSDSLAFIHLDHPVTYKDGVVPAQCLVAVSNKPVEASKLTPALQQSWAWPEAHSAVSRCRSSVIVTDFMANGLD